MGYILKSYNETIKLHKAVWGKGVILWDAAEADTIKMEIMIIITAMEAEDLIYFM